ncbi:ATP-binding protein [Paraburkholderia graminis]|uniref:ATP-binding protein n=1 Tax=Paraburkholderia graminis TaxID=60548 RepID=UPI0038B722A6
MAKINVVIAATPHDVQADGIKATIDASDDFHVVGKCVISLEKIGPTLATLSRDVPCAVILVGSNPECRDAEARWLDEWSRLVVLHVEVIGKIVRIGLQDPDNTIVLWCLRDLVERVSQTPLERISHVQLMPPVSGAASDSPTKNEPAVERPTLHAGLAWVQAVLRRAGLQLSSEVVVATPRDTRESGDPASNEFAAAEEKLNKAFAHADAETEPLAALVRSLGLTPLEFRLVLLTLAPELDVLYQRCYADLQGESGRRAGSLALYAALIDDPVEIRLRLAAASNLARWRLVECGVSHGLPAADEPMQLDRSITAWLLGDGRGLERDPRLRRVLRLASWPGASVIDDFSEIGEVTSRLQRLMEPAVAALGGPFWMLFDGDQTATWQAMLESAASRLGAPLLRVQANSIVALDVVEIGETAWRVARSAKLLRRPIFLDATTIDASAATNDALRLLLGEFAAASCRAGIVCSNVSRFIGLLGNTSVEVVPSSCVPNEVRRRSLKAATQQLGLAFSDEMLDSLEQQVPLQADGWERAMHLTDAGRQPPETPGQLTKRFIASCRDVAAETTSDLAVRLDPHRGLKYVVLPDERRQQLQQIVNSVRFARQVLDAWKFGEQLAYGRGVTALFHGPSGTGKTLSALAVAHELGSQVLCIDLSRVVSKYIGETEKHLDAVFRDATQCGAVLLIDEADTLLGKRGEIKDAHDRYSAMEVSFLLQRIEAYDGVAIFTTNARQNIDPAFLRRLAFIIEFPRPDAAARENIWRLCLPAGSHEIDDGTFRQLARKIDMTGGHIRQITKNAAFSAAAAGAKINLRHIAQASSDELAKLGLPPAPLVMERAA